MLCGWFELTMIERLAECRLLLETGVVLFHIWSGIIPHFFDVSPDFRLTYGVQHYSSSVPEPVATFSYPAVPSIAVYYPMG